MTDYDDTRFFVSYEDSNRMLLEMDYQKGKRIDSIYFIKNLGPYTFGDPYAAYTWVLLSGDYHTTIDEIDTDVNFGLDGQITGHPDWVSYKMKRRVYYPPRESKIFYSLVDFTW